MRWLIMSRLIRIYMIAILFGLFDCDPFWNNGSDQIQIWKITLQKLGDERVKHFVTDVHFPMYQ